MTFRSQQQNSDLGGQSHTRERPQFNSKVTSDRLRESSRYVKLSMSGRIRKGRRSVFREIGLDNDAESTEHHHDKPSFEEKERGETMELSSEPMPLTQERKDSIGGESRQEKTGWLSKLASRKRPRIKSAATAPPPTTGGLHRLSMTALCIAVVLPAISYNNGRQKVDISGADAGVIRDPVSRHIVEDRANSPTDVCMRWAAQSAVLNGTLYYYGGRKKTSPDQTDNEWNNDFITVDLTKSWNISSPSVSGLAQPSGPPAVSLGYLWNDFDHLYLYGGEFDYPSSEPLPVSTWQYDIASSAWTELQDPKTSAGQYSDAGGAPVQRAAEGAGVSVPELGLSWYFGGHLDWATTPGWSNQIARVYLKSLLEFTHPGYSNVQVDSLHNSGAPDSGAYRNITWAGVQNQDGFTERADGVLVYVPGWGPGGILLGLGGGVVSDHDTSDAFASMTTIDVYDIASSQWYHQQTSGKEIPQVRVNPCAVVFSAPDASSFNIYMYGGQNLLPVGQQVQYTDIWILTIPSFTWIKVDASGNEPAARAGHACAARDGQIVVVGGYIGENIKCEQPGIYAFDASKLAWQSSFNAGDHPADANAANSVLAGSYGYQVPAPVQSVIGGSSDGGATATQPASGPATDGPFKTGVPPVFTVTASGSTSTITNSPGGANQAAASANDTSRKGGLIAAGVIAGLAGLLALYLGYCAWLWRRQVRAYKRHMAVANSYGADDYGYGSGGGGTGKSAAPCPVQSAVIAGSEKLRKKDPNTRGSSSGGGTIDNDREHFGWVGQLQPPGEPKFMASASDEPSPGSGSSVRPRPSEDRNPWGWDYNNYPGELGAGAGGGGLDRSKSGASRSTRSGGSAEGLLDGREPNFFSVVLGPRRALRVVNGMGE
ncbi:hypothetical protein F5Y19DRAFT_484987 [Xylariaceae sp. FL1651]|nr:hypothetical protein F5Y19DRAFT_484987 [Xylariaceae sp. FL1651]